MKFLRRILAYASAGVLLVALSAIGAAQVQHIVGGPLYVYNNNPGASTRATAIAEEPVIVLDGEGERIGLGDGDSTAIDVYISRVAADEFGVASGDEITSGSVFRVNCTALAVADMVDQSCYIADRAVTVTRIDEVHTTAESAGTLGIMPKRQQGTEAPGSGDDLLGSGFDGTGTAETVQNGTLTGTTANLSLAAGNRLGLDFTGDTAGELAGVVVTFTLRVD